MCALPLPEVIPFTCLLSIVQSMRAIEFIKYDCPEMSVLQVLGDFEDAIKNIRLDAFKSGGDNIQKVRELAEPSVLVFIKI